MDEHEFDWTPSAEWFVVDEKADELFLACLKCTLLLYRSLASSSPTAAKGFLAAARFYALWVGAHENQEWYDKSAAATAWQLSDT